MGQMREKEIEEARKRWTTIADELESMRILLKARRRGEADRPGLAGADGQAAAAARAEAEHARRVCDGNARLADCP